MYQRNIKKKVTTALKDTPVVMLAGPRQCGKTTLVKQIMRQNWVYVTLDDINQLEFAKSDPLGFIRYFNDRRIIIDEVQRVPELFLPIKQSIDENRLPGRFLLTGSANAMALPRVADSLAGRLEIVSLLPLADCEIENKPSYFLAKILSGQIPKTKQTRIREQLISKVLSGGFPEALLRKETSRRVSWFNQYILSIVQKDIKDLGQIENLDIIPKLIQMICNQVGSLVNYTKVGNALGLSRQTVARYLQLLEQLFIFQELPAWNRNDNKRLTKTPKVHLVDSGLLCALRRINKEKINRDPVLFGSLLEAYTLCELHRLASWYDEPIYFYHYRDKDQVEVDIVLETMSGDVIGIEVKSSATLKKQDFQGLQRLKKIAGKKFLLGILLYDGDYTNRIEENIFSAPIGILWE
ncbi:MAG: ATP-binding protein [Pseudomonadota bacterium]